tara:strand:+ start:425 stop:553 length:129 start_codon:yes stop_codon:yes gene_type:complete
MIKKTILILFLLVFAFSCGKKGDPEFKEKTSKLFNTEVIVVS